ncbi:MAG TPA: hypothetical protein PKD83_05905 [Ignavibacteria bacterium]|nr:hypothetical protein [Ignavibacteria bacterium]
MRIIRNIRVTLAILFLSSFYSCDKEENSEAIDVKKEISERNEVQHKNETSSEKSDLLTITSNEIKLHIGDSLNIKGVPADIYLTDKVAYLNFENKFPKHVFSCVIFENKFNEFGDLSKFKNKNVIVTGKVTTYKNKPQVVLNSKDQIKILYNE